MANTSEFKKLLYEHEVLWARYDIRDHNLNNIVQQVYQNIGQVLSVIRIQLSLLSNDSHPDKVSAADPGNLLAAVIQELRVMCRSFYPEKDLLGKSGLIKTLENELNSRADDRIENCIKVKGLPVSLSMGTELVIFRMLQEILLFIGEINKGVHIDVTVSYKKGDVTFVIKYDGKPIEWRQFGLQADKNLLLTRLSLPERAELIDAKLLVTYNKFNKTTIKLIVPFKTSLCG